MGAEQSAHHVHGPANLHGLHFPAYIISDPSGTLPDDSVEIVVEFNAIALYHVASDSIRARISYENIERWGHSRGGTELSLLIQGRKYKFSVADAAAIEHAMMVRIDVFTHDDQFPAVVLKDSSGSLPEEVIINVNSSGFCLKDPREQMSALYFPYDHIPGWKTAENNCQFIVKLPKPLGTCIFQVENAKLIDNKLRDVIDMILHSEAHNAGEEHEHGIPLWWSVAVVHDPVGAGLPIECGLRILPDEGIRIMGRASTKKLTIRFQSLEGWVKRGADVSFTIAGGKGEFIISCESSAHAASVIAEISSVTTTLAKKQATSQRQPSYAPPPTQPRHPQSAAASAGQDLLAQALLGGGAGGAGGGGQRAPASSSAAAAGISFDAMCYDADNEFGFPPKVQLHISSRGISVTCDGDALAQFPLDHVDGVSKVNKNCVNLSVEEGTVKLRLDDAGLFVDTFHNVRGSSEARPATSFPPPPPPRSSHVNRQPPSTLPYPVQPRYPGVAPHAVTMGYRPAGAPPPPPPSSQLSRGGPPAGPPPARRQVKKHGEFVFPIPTNVRGGQVINVVVNGVPTKVKIPKNVVPGQSTITIKY